MGGDSMLRKRKRRFGSIDLGELKELSERFPVKAWVNLLLLHMFRSHIESLTLSRSKGIPSIPLEEEVPEGAFDFDKIVNRLEVMSGLDPVVFRIQREGKIPMIIGGKDFTVTTTFVDPDEDSRCSIVVCKGK
jgi:hypothetical protein